MLAVSYNYYFCIQIESVMGGRKRLKRSVKYSAIIGLINFVLFAVKIMPWKWTSFMCAQLGILGFYLVKKERLKTIKNLTIAYGTEKSDAEIYLLAREVFYNLGRGAAELAIKLNTDTEEAYFHNVEIIGREHADIRLNGWGKEVDYNMFPDEESLLKSQVNNVDAHSSFGNPLFIIMVILEFIIIPVQT